MRKKGIALICFIVVEIFAIYIFESGIDNGEKISDYQEPEKRNEAVFSNQNYLLPFEKVLLPVRRSDVIDIELTAKAVLIVDDASGKIIYEKDADKKLPIASLTKLSTALTVLELSDKNIFIDKELAGNKIYDLEKPVIITGRAIEQEGNSVSFKEGEGVKADDLMAAMLIASSNDAAWALADDVGRSMKEGGNIDDFIRLMNKMAEDEKLHETHFSNPTGIDDEANYSSARDVLHVAQRLMHYYPETFALTKIKSKNISSTDGKRIHKVENTDKLLGKMEGIVGGKTGFTDEAGEALVLIVKNNANGAVIKVAIIGSKDRFGEMEKLVHWVWDSYEWK